MCVFHRTPYLLGQMTYFIDSLSEAILYSYRWAGKKTILSADLFICSLIKEDYWILSITAETMSPESLFYLLLLLPNSAVQW